MIQNGRNCRSSQSERVRELNFGLARIKEKEAALNLREAEILRLARNVEAKIGQWNSAFEHQRALASTLESKFVTLVVGGQEFVLPCELLLQAKSSIFEAMLSERWSKNEDRIHINRSAKHFPAIIDYLRDGTLNLATFDEYELQKFLNELDFYLISIPGVWPAPAQIKWTFPLPKTTLGHYSITTSDEGRRLDIGYESNDIAAQEVAGDIGQPVLAASFALQFRVEWPFREHDLGVVLVLADKQPLQYDWKLFASGVVETFEDFNSRPRRRARFGTSSAFEECGSLVRLAYDHEGRGIRYWLNGEDCGIIFHNIGGMDVVQAKLWLPGGVFDAWWSIRLEGPDD